ncbi:hypothetical protein niasHS_013802 [Heterodera schachtii]|uniref:Secreted protein n=1 Tax=Heterodera schachtii TaxID=97005 RepID=A0ABD2IS67_HETSC
MIVFLLIGEAFAGSLLSKPKSGETSKSRIQSSNAKPKSEIKIQHHSRTQRVTTRVENAFHQRTITQRITQWSTAGVADRFQIPLRNAKQKRWPNRFFKFLDSKQ